MVMSSGVSAELDPAVAFRDQILAAFLADPATILMRRDDRVAIMRLESGHEVVLIACPAGVPPAELRTALDEVIQRPTADIVQVVAVGSDRKVRRALKRAIPFWQLRTRFGGHHVDLAGHIKRVTGLRFGLLEQIVANAPSAPAIPEADFASRLAQGRERHGEEARLDTALRGRFPWVTAALIAICSMLFLFGKLWAGVGGGNDASFGTILYRMGANSGVDVKNGQLWRLLASAFLHANVEHIIVNMAALATFGPVLERLLGPRRYIVLYGLSALGGGLASALLRGPGMSVGASGAIWGLMAAGVGLALRPGALLPPTRLARARRQTIIPLVLNLLYSFSPGIDLFAHFGGGLVGFTLMASGLITRGVTPLWTATSDAAPRQQSSPAMALLSWALAVALIGSVAISLVEGRPWEIDEPPALTYVQLADTGVSVEVPRGLAGALKEEKMEGGRDFVFARPESEPLIVELGIIYHPDAPRPEEIETIMESERKAFEEASPAGLQREGAATLVTIGGRRFATVAHRANGVPLRSWISLFGRREVVLRVYSLPSRPSSWAGVEDKIVASLRGD
jgi:membrane associated rhomboid family serine protease